MSLHKVTVYEKLNRLIETGDHSDITFVLKDCKRVRGHKLLFKIASPVFAAMMSGDWVEKGVIMIDDIEFEAFKTVMCFIYTDEIHFESVYHAAAVFEAAHKYNIPYLEKIAEEYILNNLDVSDVCRILEFSKLFDKTEIEEACMMMIKFDTVAVLDSTDFVECNFDTLQTIVSEPYLNVDEIKLFNSVEKWAEHFAFKQGLTIDAVALWLRPVLRRIRYLSMTVDEFVEGPKKSKLLLTDECQSFCMKLTGRGDVNIPEGFSTSGLSRKQNDLQLISSSRKNGKYFSLIVRWKKNKISSMEPYVDYHSPQFVLNNLIWRISAKQVNLLGKKYLDLNLICDGDQRSQYSEWSCKVNYTFRIMAETHQSLISTIRSDLFCRENNTCGWNPFVLWSTFTNPHLMLVTENCATIELQITVED